MRRVKRLACLLFAGWGLLGAPGLIRAEQLRLHYVPGPNGTALLQGSPNGTAGERVSFFGAVREPNRTPLRANYLVTFRHAYTGQLVTVPLAFPEGTPRLEYRADRIVYNYGSYSIHAIFLRDGSVDIVYKSGFRPL